jgi:hypothetical protein
LSLSAFQGGNTNNKKKKLNHLGGIKKKKRTSQIGDRLACCAKKVGADSRSSASFCCRPATQAQTETNTHSQRHMNMTDFAIGCFVFYYLSVKCLLFFAPLSSFCSFFENDVATRFHSKSFSRTFFFPSFSTLFSALSPPLLRIPLNPTQRNSLLIKQKHSTISGFLFSTSQQHQHTQKKEEKHMRFDVCSARRLIFLDQKSCFELTKDKHYNNTNHLSWGGGQLLNRHQAVTCKY